MGLKRMKDIDDLNVITTDNVVDNRAVSSTITDNQDKALYPDLRGDTDLKKSIPDIDPVLGVNSDNTIKRIAMPKDSVLDGIVNVQNKTRVIKKMELPEYSTSLNKEYKADYIRNRMTKLPESSDSDKKVIVSDVKSRDSETLVTISPKVKESDSYYAKGDVVVNGVELDTVNVSVDGSIKMLNGDNTTIKMQRPPNRMSENLSKLETVTTERMKQGEVIVATIGGDKKIDVDGGNRFLSAKEIRERKSEMARRRAVEMGIITESISSAETVGVVDSTDTSYQITSEEMPTSKVSSDYDIEIKSFELEDKSRNPFDPALVTIKKSEGFDSSISIEDMESISKGDTFEFKAELSGGESLPVEWAKLDENAGSLIDVSISSDDEFDDMVKIFGDE